MFRAIMIWLMFVAASARGQSESVLPEISGFWYMQTTSWFPVGTNMNFEYTEHVLQYSSEPEQLAYGLSWRALTNFDFEQIGWLAVDQSSVYFRSTSPYHVGYVSYYDTTMRQVYDFDLAIGDTAYLTNPPSSEFPAIVWDIDTAFIASAPRTRFILDNGDIIVTGIGSLQGLLRPLLYHHENYFELLDYCGEYLDTDSIQYTGCWPNAVGVAQTLNPNISIFPNPNGGEFSILHSDPGTNYTVLDMRGATIVSGLSDGESRLVGRPISDPGRCGRGASGRRCSLIIE